MRGRWIALLALTAAVGQVHAEPPRWSAGATLGAAHSSLGGADPAASGGGFGFVVGPRASFVVLPWLSLAAELVYVHRQIGFADGVYSDWRGELDLTRFDLPVVARFHTPTAPVSGFVLAGGGVAFGASASHPVSDEGGEPEVDVSGTDLFLDAGLGACWQRASMIWSLDLRYRHGLGTLDPESPGLDIRVHTVLLEAALEWTLQQSR